MTLPPPRTGIISAFAKFCHALTGGTPTWSISGTISPSSAGAGATVTLSGLASATTTANSSGNYTFTGLANGTYTVTPISPGYSFTPSGQTVTINGAAIAAVNFSGTGQNVLSISGTISPSTGGGGASVTLGGAANQVTTASASGSYSFSGLANGTYSITPSNQGFSFSPLVQPVVVNGGNASAVNFTASPAAGGYVISGTLSPAQFAVGATVTLSGPGERHNYGHRLQHLHFCGPPGGYLHCDAQPLNRHLQSS